MSIFNIIGNTISGIGEAVSKFVDSINAPDEQKAELRSKLNSELNNLTSQVLQSQDNYEKELTERLKADMQSDSWLAKNVRPITLIFILGMFTLTSIPSIWNLKIDSQYIEILKDWGQLAFMFYFGGRSVEKIISSTKGKINFKGNNESN